MKIGDKYGDLEIVNTFTLDKGSYKENRATIRCVCGKEWDVARRIKRFLERDYLHCGCKINDHLIGEVFSSENYGDYRVIRSVDSNNLEIEFLDTGYTNVVQKHDIGREDGSFLRDRLKPTICGIGYIGEGIYQARAKVDRCYHLWKSMLCRCYNKKDNSYKFYGAKGITVCEEWYNYQNFAEWCHAQDGFWKDGYHLDKDLKVEGNTIYSPLTCQFIPREVNCSHLNKREKTVWVFKNQEGVLLEVRDLKGFCKDSNLSYHAMINVGLGRQKQNKGYTFNDKYVHKAGEVRGD